MLSSFLESLSLDHQELSSLPLAVSVVVSSVVLYVVWTRRRNLPKGVCLPPHLTSYIPFIGSGLQLISGLTRDFILKSAKKLKTPVFTANISGTKCVFIADPELVFTVFKDSIEEIDSLSLQKKAMSSISGVDPSIVEACLSNQEMSKAAMGQIHKHLIQSDHLSKNIESVQHVIENTLQSMDLPNGGDEWKSFPMFEFVRKVIFFASIGPIVSEGLNQDEVVQDYSKFEDGIALMFSDAPSFITKENVAARERLVQILQTSQVHEGFSDFMKERQELLGYDKELMARMNVGMFIATVSNSIPSVFWILCHLLHTPETFAACVQEVQKVAKKKSKNDTHSKFFTLEELDEMKLLESCFKESLRMYQSFFATRNVTGDFILNPKEKNGPQYLIEKGTRIMAYPQTVHMDPAIFQDPTEFRFDRFLHPTEKAPDGKLLSSYLRPFGGGAHLCPGRKFISYEARAFLAMLLLNVDMKLQDVDEPIPDIQLQRQGFSVAHPKKDPTFLVKVKTNTRSS